MKFTVELSALNKALKIVSPAIQRNVVLPICESIKIVKEGSKTKVFATDLHLSIITCINVESKEDFEAVLPFKILYNISANHKSKLATIVVEDKGITALIDDKKFGLGAFENPDNFPAINDVGDNTPLIKLSNEVLYKLQESVACAAADGDALYKDIGIRINDNDINIASTDKLLLFKYSEPIETKQVNSSISIPVNFVKSISEIEEANLFIDNKTIKIQSNGSVFIGRQTDEKFPFDAADNILSNHEPNCHISKLELMESVNNILSYGTVLPFIDFVFTPNTVKIKYEDADFQYSFDGEIKASHSANAEKIRFNAKQLKTIIDVYEDEEIDFYVPDSGYSIQLISKDKRQKIMIQSIMF